MSWERKDMENEWIAAFVAQYTGMISSGMKANPDVMFTIAQGFFCLRK